MNGAVALVTGADNPRGIGRAVVRALAERGAVVACTVLPGSTASEAEIGAVPIEADLSDPEAPEALLAAVEAFVGRPAILVNNAAHSTTDGYEALDAATLDAHWAVNVRAPALLSCELARRHDPGTPGRIVNLVSGQFLGPMPGELAYTATKGALQAFTVQLAAEVAALGITVNAVGPGPNDTGWIDDALREQLVPRFPAGRIGRPDDAARLVAWLCSEEAAWVTGQVIHAEGGFVRS
ncbi:MAG: 3-oxoacyl-[acyl-carrier protein] reductase [Solirubrobacteraceae bacterium]|jgi:3-oxoacyl-[acyl-carrier protein] reductase|nr:3-oxoacyl-[acyl-carrier protein] reductase [Solirubrobacteraceae bacterium]MEA2289687.1 3-oxoacyl-[acyl-carrier protein] reductase [Solirubrobacteraceae bacterium]